jgi:hypothetical protein
LTSPTSVPSSRSIQVQSCSDRAITLAVLFATIDPTDDLLTANVWVCVGKAAAAELVKSKAASATVSVEGVRATLSAGSGEVSSPGEQTRLGAATIPIDGDPRRYPFDVYRASVLVSLAGTRSTLAQLPLSLRSEQDPGVSAFDWRASTARLSPTTVTIGGPVHRATLVDSQRLSIEAFRPINTKLFVGFLSLVPLILIFVLAARLMTAPPRSVEDLAAIAAIMLAILPIRTVLVPSDISALTVVDFTLGFEMALLAAGVALVNLWPQLAPTLKRWLAQRDGQPPPPGA